MNSKKRWKLMSVVVFGLVILIVGIGTVGVALAINFGVPDGGEHPYVGVLVFTNDGITFPFCSGTLIAPQVFLTAGHCAVDATAAWVSFEEVPAFDFTTWTIKGHGVAHPDFGDFALPNTNDIGVILLDEPVTMETYGVLAPLGYLDSFKSRTGLVDRRRSSSRWATVITATNLGLSGI